MKKDQVKRIRIDGDMEITRIRQCPSVQLHWKIRDEALEAHFFIEMMQICIGCYGEDQDIEIPERMSLKFEKFMEMG
jgi:hypothetical protein